MLLDVRSHLGLARWGEDLRIPYPVWCSWRNLSFTGSGRSICGMVGISKSYAGFSSSDVRFGMGICAHRSNPEFNSIPIH